MYGKLLKGFRAVPASADTSTNASVALRISWMSRRPGVRLCGGLERLGACGVGQGVREGIGDAFSRDFRVCTNLSRSRTIGMVYVTIGSHLLQNLGDRAF
jgi:hypothetical protein